ncbi:hypothetical protein PT974_04961 [Cladobotryum mycophilum]|uniref:Heterokaryon incompatibility domain-containing protein n=1 Tax=Cladobotryum mycophilum TaxID=491253 RepID=A0ABR0SQV4_9HYPO
MFMTEAYGRSVLNRDTLPVSFKKLEGKMPKIWATSNVVPDELYGCYDEDSDRALLDAFGLVRYRACEVTDPVGWEVEQITASTGDNASSRGAQIEVRDMRSGESYVALSYAWVEANNNTLQSAVERIYEETKVTVFWIDQFCINQSCDTHKAEQVPKWEKSTRMRSMLPAFCQAWSMRLRQSSAGPPSKHQRTFAQHSRVFGHPTVGSADDQRRR